MNILAIETSSPCLSVAAGRLGGRVFEMNFEAGLRHSENLMHAIQHVLKSARLGKHDLDVIAYGRGPGSFTGLRIGLAAVKGLAAALQTKVIGVSSLDLIALQLPEHETEIAVTLDARREALYAAFYQYRANKWQVVKKQALVTYEAWCREVKPQSVIAGDALKSYGSRMKEDLPASVRWAPEKDWYPKAAAIFKWFQIFKRSIPYQSLEDIKPYYLRLSEAEERRRLRRL
ncbi:MAG: tRNA (adenosine(37)-N6)-threonylcarbamoyltransferase complex dimerization subunit type 1 TsaB [Candidatus Omnitrophica bacterium CG11_big_fil_rev_8_21_14_0_20_45_26]|uniref:tRNA (Adenosine(37)-N6)-threonylcarbamoyltransferase complex dimerization subunit type 1 TsaB n=1 Tax=Candidatus Abzuiibacterium crystallinum TaxID=1974748 RepID=A0A2H0LPI0_9BACT|nr:MAG: tRNA (adenosine(37)-N6)-threonylcarbamoyltransferase complex dimerization subunit type 1 TsaB [Candidatus Omnitrophica bacterium CG11_big_fil_rev_8_21_14_0_20_45_26]PIW63537.1 MAG: tRNA (adenosine(37)-N6)-threonylcarbamoyltransferase complex dimerization subunit type 1 TsaB [Candidatus Omnitrophica bacterium CG12_big_fil_rev_8_21_14_0_65_45_16]